MGALKNIFTRTFQRLREGWDLHKYDRFTIAEYFRKLGATVGGNCSIIPTELGTEPYLVKIGNHVAIATGVKFITHDGGAWIFRNEIPDIQVFGPIEIGDNCVIGENAILLPNIKIGENSIIGSGSVIISDIPPNSIAMGNPARVWGSVEKYKEKCINRWEEQKPKDVVIEPGKNWWNSQHYPENVVKLKKHLINLFWNQPKDPDSAS